MRSFLTAATVLAALIALACSDPTTPPAPPTLPASVTTDLAGFDSIPSWGLLFLVSVRDVRPLFADSSLGKTFRWDCDSSRYVGTATLPGAPLDGIRFLLYGSTDTGQPICPLVTLAYYDIHDVGTVDSPSVHIAVRDTSLAVSYLDYTIRATAQGSAFSATLSGFVTNGPQRFDVAGTASGTSTLRARTLVATRVGSGAQVVIQQSEDYSVPVVALHGDTRLIHGGDTVRLAGTLTGTGIGTLNVDVNDRHFATVNQGDSTTTYTGPDGRVLTAPEEEAVLWMRGIGALGYTVVNEMLQPAGWLLGFNAHHP